MLAPTRDRAWFDRVWKLLLDMPRRPRWFGYGIPMTNRVTDDASAAFELYSRRGPISVGEKHGLIARIEWPRDGLLEIFVAVDAPYDPSWLEWTAALCETCPTLFGIATSRAESARKHEVITEYQQARSRGSVGPSWGLQEGLPGVYWMTVLGALLTDAFPVAKVAAIPGVTVRALAAGQTMILAGTSPLDDLGELEHRERQIAETLGDSYFFDRHRPDRTLDVVPALAEVLRDAKARALAAAMEDYARGQALQAKQAAEKAEARKAAARERRRRKKESDPNK
jgi:hypothetical protein